MDKSSGESVFVSIVLCNSLVRHSELIVRRCFDTLTKQDGFDLSRNLHVLICDNASNDGTAEFLTEELPDHFVLRKNKSNLGFCGANNQAAKDFLDSEAGYFLLLNPDVALAPQALIELIAAFHRHPQAGMTTPKLLRGDSELKPYDNSIIDAAGMQLESSLRHFDRGSGEVDVPLFSEERLVFGGTGACLLMKRSFVEDALLDAGEWEQDAAVVCESLRTARDLRVPLFDEAFFAYREDADLAWRAQILGWQCVYAPGALGVHRRVVTADRRAALPPEFNLMGVRNRFLLQLNNLPNRPVLAVLIVGIIIRNLVVLLGVVVFERSSLPALRQVLRLRQRARERRRILYQRARASTEDLRSCFIGSGR